MTHLFPHRSVEQSSECFASSTKITFAKHRHISGDKADDGRNDAFQYVKYKESQMSSSAHKLRLNFTCCEIAKGSGSEELSSDYRAQRRHAMYGKESALGSA